MEKECSSPNMCCLFPSLPSSQSTIWLEIFYCKAFEGRKDQNWTQYIMYCVIVVVGHVAVICTKQQSSKKIPSNPSWSRCQKKLNSKEYLIEPKKVCFILNPTKITGKSYLTLEEAKNNFITFGSCFWKRNWQVKDFKKSSFWEELTRFA